MEEGLPSSLLGYVRGQLASALPHASEQRLDLLLHQLVQLAHQQTRPVSWIHQAARKATTFLLKGWADDAALRRAVEQGEMTVSQLLQLAEEHTASAAQMYQHINGHHQRLKQQVSEGSCWQEARDNDPEALRLYAQARSLRRAIPSFEQLSMPQPKTITQQFPSPPGECDPLRTSFLRRACSSLYCERL